MSKGYVQLTMATYNFFLFVEIKMDDRLKHLVPKMEK